MAEFQDKRGRKWTVEITVADIPRLAAAGLSVVEMGRDPTKIFRAVLADPEAFGRGLWVLIEKQAEAAGETVDEFASALDGPTLFAAMAALEDAVVLFTLPPATSRKVLEMLPAARAKANQEMERVAERVMADETAKIGGSNANAGNSPGPSDSPTPGP